MKKLILICISASFMACKADENLLATEFFQAPLPSYIAKNQLLDGIPVKGIALGEQLFFDVNLSSNKKVSCGTCHQKQLAFADGKILSNAGVSGQTLNRHTPVLFNLAWQKGYFWDGGAPDLSSQALGPLFAHEEMDADLNQIISYLKSNTNYQKMFKTSFDNGEINSINILKALSWYQLSLISFDSKYDSFRSRNDSSLLSSKEIKGLKVYESQCNSCHTLPMASSYQYANNELDSGFDYPFEDVRLGRNRITNKSEDLGKYKIPSLRNLNYTAPYMHDGRMANLDQVLNHYQSIHTQNIQTEISKTEQDNLKLFLNTLNDASFITK